MIFDAHLHLFRNGYRFAGASPLGGHKDVEAYEALTTHHGIGGGLVVCYEAEGIDPGNNAYVRELARSRPWIASVAYLDAAQPPIPSAIAQLLSQGHAGIALYLGDAEAAGAIDRWPADSWQLLSRSRALVSLNARPDAIAALEPLIRRAQGCQFLFSHLGLPGPTDTPLSSKTARLRLGPLLRLAALGDVGVKISGLYAVDPLPPHAGAKPLVEALIEAFDAADLHWGSDFSPVLEFTSFQDTLRIPGLENMAEENRRLLMGEGLVAKLRRVARP